MRSFLATEQLNILEESFQVNGEVIYPDYYAGCYLDNNYNPTIVVTDSFTNSDLNQIIEVTGNTEIVIEYGAEHSYQELVDLRNQVRDYYYNHCYIPDDPILSNLTSTSINLHNNCLDVSLLEPSEAAILEFKSAVYPIQALSDTPIPINFIQNDRLSYAEPGDINNRNEPVTVGDQKKITQYCGKLIYLYNTNGYSTASLSIGFPAKLYSGTTIIYGFITAGHDIQIDNLIKDSQYLSASYIGECIAQRVNGTVDAAFVSLTNRNLYDVTSAVSYTDRIAGIGMVQEGTAVTRYGGKSTSSGKVMGVSDEFKEAIIYVNGEPVFILLTDMIHTGPELTCIPGDSGGPLCIRAGNGNLYAAGILCGQGGTGHCFFTNIKNILRSDQSGMELVFDIDR